MRILVIEDDAEVAALILYVLEDAGYRVDHAPDGERGLALVNEAEYNLIILDLQLPRVDGWTVCEAVRAPPGRDMPILMMSVHDSVEERVRGLDMGADDYLVKPFAFLEFSARVRALLRRDRARIPPRIRISDLEIDTVRHRVRRGGIEIALNRREYTLLEALASQPGHVFTRDIIQEKVWRNDMASSATVDVHIGMLRRKIDSAPREKLIHTVRGMGYMLHCDPDLTTMK